MSTISFLSSPRATLSSPRATLPRAHIPRANLSIQSRKLTLSIRASKNPNSKTPTTTTNNNNNKAFGIIKTTLVSSIAAAAVFFARHNNVPFVFRPPVTMASEGDVMASESDVMGMTDDVGELKKTMEGMIKEGKVEEAINIVDRLMDLEPEDKEWPLMKAHLYCYNGQVDKAREGFDELLEKDPTRVEAYHGLVMAASEGDSGTQLKDIEKRVREAMEKCKKEKTEKDDLRDFKLLIAQIRVIEGDYDEALKIYQDLVNEEPRDFRPYLCQGIIYTLLKKTDEAEKQFEKYRRLVPKGHPYAQYFDDNMIATKLFGQKVENESATTKS